MQKILSAQCDAYTFTIGMDVQHRYRGEETATITGFYYDSSSNDIMAITERGDARIAFLAPATINLSDNAGKDQQQAVTGKHILDRNLSDAVQKTSIKPDTDGTLYLSRKDLYHPNRSIESISIFSFKGAMQPMHQAKEIIFIDDDNTKKILKVRI